MIMPIIRRRLVVLASAFLVGHLLLLPPTPGDIDSLNFALGVSEFDVARHQPHPPGYAIFIAASKVSTWILETIHVPGAEARGIALWGAVLGTLMVPGLFVVFREAGASEWQSWWATLLTVTCPIIWFTAARPLSDVPGFAVAVVAQACLLRGMRQWQQRGPLLIGAFVAGVAIGVRSQTFLLTLPLLAVVLSRHAIAARVRLAAATAFVVGVLCWAGPLLWATGGVSGYVSALGQQAEEDFTGVVMFWNFPVLATARSVLWHTFVAPWTSPLLAFLMLGAAASGVTLLRSRTQPFFVAVLWGPYLLFHLLFHEPVTVRYALPVVPLVVWLAVLGLSRIPPRAVPLAVGGVAAAGLILTLPAAVKYGTQPAPIVRALHDLQQARRREPVTVASHRRVAAESRRVREWLGFPERDWLPSPIGREWLELTRRWRNGDAAAAWFFMTPRRTDLALIDSRDVQRREYRWGFDSRVFMGGARPAEFNVTVYSRPPRWFLENGWALTPEVAGITERQGHGPHLRPSIGWIHRTEHRVDMVLAGRNLGPAGAPAVRMVAAVDGRTVLDREVPPGPFNEVITLEPGYLSGSGPYVQLLVRAEPTVAGLQPVALEQFDVQPSGVPMFAYGGGWHEPEYSRSAGRLWRWMSDRASMWVRPVGRDLTLRISAEAPLRYFKTPLQLRLMIGERQVAALAAAGDLDWAVTLPHALLAAHAGQLTIEADKHFVPAQRGRGRDRRTLSLRVYGVSVE